MVCKQWKLYDVVVVAVVVAVSTLFLSSTWSWTDAVLRLSDVGRTDDSTFPACTVHHAQANDFA